MEKEELQQFINLDFVYAIVGATQTQEKYGYKVFTDLKTKGYKVIPVNPNYNEIDGEVCYPDLISLPDRPDVVVLIVGEKNAENTVRSCVDLNLDKIWFQPGSEYEPAVEIVKEAGFDYIVNECIMKEAGKVERKEDKE